MKGKDSMEKINTDPLKNDELVDGGKKVRCLEIRRPDSHGESYRCVVGMNHDMRDEFDGAEDGEIITVTYREMPRDEYLQLPEFTGW